MNTLPDLAEPLNGTDRFAVDGMTLAPAGLPPAAPPAPGDVAVNIFGSIVTAQRVVVPRSHARIIQQLKALCAMAGDGYVYSWPVKDRRNQRETIVEGPTIKLANDLARTYGNCLVDVRVVEDGNHWTFYARFTDLETGFSYTRPFQQRKAQDTGMRDAERQRDIVFQIGASKAIRNVVVNALSTYVDFMIEESKAGLLRKVQENQDKAHAFIDRVMERHGIAVSRVEAVIGRKRAQWTVRDLARVYTEMRGIADGMTVADEVYPTEEAAREVAAAKAEAKADLKPAKPAPKAAPKAAPKPAPQPEPEPEPEPEEAPADEPEPAEASDDDDEGGLFGAES